ncbi:MAG: hypothetical protein K0Q79_1413 [Flavipsychrobacter sp.]|jgi:effector-binding domain-containing protein|nr:hypothetical protein [Flavipsychrobacter sp.]
MKKILKFLLILIIVLIAGVLIAGLVMPKEVFVTRTELMNASKEQVLEQTAKFKNWPNWSYWHAMDTGMKLTYEGVDGEPGSFYTWESDQSGRAKLSNTGVSGNSMKFHIDFYKPFENTADGEFIITDTAGMSKITWNFKTTCPFPMNGLQIFPFMDMKRMLGTAFEEGLKKMKAHIESEPKAPAATMEIKEVDYPAHIFQGIRKTVSWNDIGQFFGESMGLLGAGIGDKIAGPGTGLYYTWDTAKHNSDMVAAFPVSDTTKKVKGSVIIHQEASKALMLEHKGPYGGMMGAHMALGQEVAAKGKTVSLVIEEYIVGMPAEMDSTKFVTNIYYLVK